MTRNGRQTFNLFEEAEILVGTTHMEMSTDSARPSEVVDTFLLDIVQSNSHGISDALVPMRSVALL